MKRRIEATEHLQPTGQRVVGRPLPMGVAILVAAACSTALLGQTPGVAQPGGTSQAPAQQATPPATGSAPAPQASAVQGPESAATQALVTVLDRAQTTLAGTYGVNRGQLERLDDPLPVVLQADVRRGADQMMVAALALGATVPQAAVTRARIVASDRPTPEIVAEVSGSSPAGLLRAVGEAAVLPGVYEMHGAVAHVTPTGGAVVSLAKSRLVVPNIWSGSLAVSPVVLGDAVAAAPATSAGSPFVFGPTIFRPTAGGRFPQSGELHVGFRVYNWSAPSGQRPDLTVEYVFYERTPRQAVFFNKVKPQLLNAQTLGERFAPESGAVNGGMSIPLASFPITEFQLTVRVTDTRTKQTASQEAVFAVVR